MCPESPKCYKALVVIGGLKEKDIVSCNALNFSHKLIEIFVLKNSRLIDLPLYLNNVLQDLALPEMSKEIVHLRLYPRLFP